MKTVLDRVYAISSSKMVEELQRQRNEKQSQEEEKQRKLAEDKTGSYKDPREIWKAIQKISRGKTENNSPYIIHDNMRIYDEEGKEEAFRSIWDKLLPQKP